MARSAGAESAGRGRILVTADSKQVEDGEESALSRWSRRKLEARRQAESGLPPREAEEALESAPSRAGEAVEPEPEKPVLSDADMPDVDSLDENSDYSQFMSAGVSDKLRNLALRKLFHTPSFNIRDGLDEYDDDFTQFEKLGDIVTSDMKHRIEMEQQKLREKLAEQQAEGEAVETDSAELDAVEDIEDDEEAQPDVAAAGGERQANPDTPVDGGDNDVDAPRHG